MIMDSFDNRVGNFAIPLHSRNGHGADWDFVERHHKEQRKRGKDDF